VVSVKEIMKHITPYSPITLDKNEYKELIKTYSQSEPPYGKAYSIGYVRCLYDYDLITRNQWNYLLRIISKYGTILY